MKYVEIIYGENRPLTEYPNKLSKYLFDIVNMKGGLSLLDIGCGRGEVSKGFKNLGINVFSTDLLPSKYYKDVISNSEKNIPFKDNSFNIIFCKSVIEHFYNPEYFMEECHRVLKPNGKLILMTPDWHSQMKIFYDDYTHRQPYTVEAIKDLFKIFDFKPLKIEKFYQLPILWKYPKLKIISKILQKFIVPSINIKNKFIRFSVELMIIGIGEKNVK